MWLTRLGNTCYGIITTAEGTICNIKTGKVFVWLGGDCSIGGENIL